MMRRDESLATALFALVIGAAIAAAIASDITAPLCEAAKIKSMAPDKIEFGCFEFWLNRYQSMLQTIVSSAIGAVGLYFILRQLKELGNQNEITRATLAATLEAERTTRRAVVGRAVVALESIKPAQDHMKQFAMKMAVNDSLFGYDIQIVDDTKIAVAAIYPALFTEESKKLWRQIADEVDTISTYLGFRSKGYSEAQTLEVYLDEVGRPRGDEDVITRAMALYFLTIRLRRVMEANL